MILNIEEIRDLCKEMGIVPTKSKGQNFLIDGEALNDIVAAADLSQGDTVVEVGPGFGVLTEELIKEAGKVKAVELDERLFGYLRSRFKGQDNLELVRGDILEMLEGKGFLDSLSNSTPPSRLRSAPSIHLPSAEGRTTPIVFEEGYKVVANLPYQITSRVLRLFLEAENKPKEMVVMVQKEVGERICAEPGEMSVLAVMVQYYGEPEIVRVVDKKSFWPVPEVDSVVLKINSRRSHPRSRGDSDGAIGIQCRQSPLTGDSAGTFFRVVKVGFSARRKMLKKNLGNVFDKTLVKELMDELGLDEKVRAQELGVEEWRRLASSICKRQLTLLLGGQARDRD